MTVTPSRLTAAQRSILAAHRHLPRSSRDVARDISRQRKLVAALQAQIKAAQDPATKARLSTQLTQELRHLAELIAAAKAKALARKKQVLPAGQVRVGVDTQKLATKQLLSQLQDLREKQKALQGQIAASRVPSMTLKLKSDLRETRQKIQRVKQRLALLQKGKDLAQITKIPPSHLKRTRKILVLPRAYALPSKAVVALTIRLLAARIPKRPGESRLHYLARLRAYVQRALVRFAILRSQKIEEAVAVDSAVAETMVDDSSVIEAEADAGGIAEDSVAEAMDVAIDPVASQLESAGVDNDPVAASTISESEFVSSSSAAQAASDIAAVSAAASTATPSEADALQKAAAQAVVEASSASSGSEDLLSVPAEDIEEIAWEDEEEQPWWGRTEVMLGAAIVGGFLIVRALL